MLSRNEEPKNNAAQRGIVLLLSLFGVGCRTTPQAAMADPALDPAPHVSAETVEDKIVEVVAGSFATCVRSAKGRVACMGQLVPSDTATDEIHIPKRIDVPPSKALSAGRMFACSVDRDLGTVRCWGSNEDAQLGEGSRDEQSSTPVVLPTLAGVDAIVSRGVRSCALAAEGVTCWPDFKNSESMRSPWHAQGERTPQQALSDHLGLTRFLFTWDPGPTHSLWRAHAPVDAETCGFLYANAEAPSRSSSCSRSGLPPIEVTADMQVGSGHACGLSDGQLRCDGRNDNGQRARQASATSQPYVDFAVGANHTCALDAGGRLFCWGSSYRGQIGIPKFPRRGAIRVAEDVQHAWTVRGMTCVQKLDGETLCTAPRTDPCAQARFEPLEGPQGDP